MDFLLLENGNQIELEDDSGALLLEIPIPPKPYISEISYPMFYSMVGGSTVDNG